MSARFYIARHGETVFNAAARLQGDAPHTPLTRAGFAQADAIGAALRAELGRRPAIGLWSSDTGRALQTLAVIAEHLERDWRDVRTDDRLREINKGTWGGQTYAELTAKFGPIYDPRTLLFTQRGPGGEWYDGLTARLRSWLDEHGGGAGDHLVITHGITSRVLRRLLTGTKDDPGSAAPVADPLPQGSIVVIADGCETVLLRGGGGALA